MVRDVRFITLNSSYRDLQEMLLTGQLKTLALVESRGMKKKTNSSKQVLRFSSMLEQQFCNISGLDLVLFKML